MDWAVGECPTLDRLAPADITSTDITVRAGVPQIYGAIVKAAHEARIPVLFSANAFSVCKDGEFKRFNLTAARNMPGDLDAALDSAGFVAAFKYGGYRWSEEQYLELVASRDWAWWASQDYCVELPVAGNLVTKEVRLQATAIGYFRCRELARRWGVKPPMPVLQGWFPQDYVRCAEMLALRDEEWPDLVGIGSVCRRNVSGPDGIGAVLETLDQVLPAHVRFHAFGVKGGAVQQLGASRRFSSLDSMAWDFGVRADHRTGRTQQLRIDRMLSWQATQAAVVPDLYQPAPVQGELTFGDRLGECDDEFRVPPEIPEAVVHRAVAAWYGEYLLADHGYREIAWMALRQTELIMATLDSQGGDALAESTDMADMAAYDALANVGYVAQRAISQSPRERAAA